MKPAVAEITKAAPTHKRGGAGRGMFRVKCCCGHVNYFDAFSWGGHGALKCKGYKCGLYIENVTGRTVKTRAELLR